MYRYITHIVVCLFVDCTPSFMCLVLNLMRLPIILSVSLWVLATGSHPVDPCAELATILGLSGTSFTDGAHCAGLFWEGSRRASNICFWSDESSSELCPEWHPVTAAEATSEVLRRRALLFSGGGAGTSSAVPRNSSMDVSGAVSLPVVVSTNPTLRFIAYGDSGLANEELALTASMIRRKFQAHGLIDAVLMLGDNFYPNGIHHKMGVHDPQFDDVFQKIVALDMPVPFYTILGNHDWLGDVGAQLAYGSVDPRWVMPSLYYFQRFQNSNFTTCVWFLDTDRETRRGGGVNRFDSVQQEWLNRTIGAEKSTCTWLIVVGHHPIFDVGEYDDDAYMIESLLPILNEHQVHMYITGHEHQSQVMYNRAVSNTTFIIAGCTADIRSKITKPDHPMYVFSHPTHLAFLHMEITHDVIQYAFHRAHGGVGAHPMFQAAIVH